MDFPELPQSVVVTGAKNAYRNLLRRRASAMAETAKSRQRETKEKTHKRDTQQHGRSMVERDYYDAAYGWDAACQTFLVIRRLVAPEAFGA